MKRFRILSIVMIVVILLGSMGISSAAADPIEEKRQELAELYGFDTYADMFAHRSMMGTGAAALDFVDDVMQGIKPPSDALYQLLLSLRNRYENTGVRKLPLWDYGYYNNLCLCFMHGDEGMDDAIYFSFENALQGAPCVGQLLASIAAPAICDYAQRVAQVTKVTHGGLILLGRLLHGVAPRHATLLGDGEHVAQRHVAQHFVARDLIGSEPLALGHRVVVVDDCQVVE